MANTRVPHRSSRIQLKHKKSPSSQIDAPKHNLPMPLPPYRRRGRASRFLSIWFDSKQMFRFVVESRAASVRYGFLSACFEESF